MTSAGMTEFIFAARERSKFRWTRLGHQDLDHQNRSYRQVQIVHSFAQMFSSSRVMFWRGRAVVWKVIGLFYQSVPRMDVKSMSRLFLGRL